MNYSYSKFQTYLDCPRQYKKRYIDYEKFYPTYEMKLGTKIHNILQVYCSNLKRGYKSGLKSIIDNHFIINKDFMLYSECHNILNSFDNKKFPIEFLYKTEISGKFKLDNNIINFKIDRLDDLGTDGINIIEYKTGKINNELTLQDKIYSISTKKLFINCSKLKVSKYFVAYNEIVEHTIDFEDFELWEDEIRKIIEQIETDVEFLPNIGKKCEFCCYGVKNSLDKWGQM